MDPSRPGFPAELNGYRLVFDDDFAGPDLDASRWLPVYLPHWSSRERTRPRYAVEDGCLTLRIDPDQEPWCPEFNGAVKVSSVQTAQVSGPSGSAIGQHRFRDGLVVREEQSRAVLWAPRHGAIEMRARADIAQNNLVALFLVGLEERPEDAGEITVMEVFGRNVSPEGTRLGHGIKAIRDPRLTTDVREERLPFSISDWHVYAVEWTPEGVSFFLDGRLLRRLDQSPNYPMMLMLNIYELPPQPQSPVRLRPGPATFTIDFVRGYEPA